MRRCGDGLPGRGARLTPPEGPSFGITAAIAPGRSAPGIRQTARKRATGTGAINSVHMPRSRGTAVARHALRVNARTETDHIFVAQLRLQKNVVCDIANGS